MPLAAKIDKEAAKRAVYALQRTRCKARPAQILVRAKNALSQDDKLN